MGGEEPGQSSGQQTYDAPIGQTHWSAVHTMYTSDNLMFTETRRGRALTFFTSVSQSGEMSSSLSLTALTPLSLKVKLATRMLRLGCLLAGEIFRDEKVSLFDTLPGLCKTGNDHDLGIQF